MKTSFQKWLILTPVLCSVMLASCTTTHSPHSTVAHNAVMCDKCKTTWITGVESGGKVTRYTRQKAMVCPDCTSAVENWVRTGVLKHSCSHCGGKMTCELPH